MTELPNPEHALDYCHRMPAPDPNTPAIAYDEVGGGPAAVVFLHGIGGNRSNWRVQLESLAGEGFRAIAWDARGYGRSEDYAGPLDFADFSLDLARLLDHLGCQAAHLVGLSMGGRILQDFYPRFADRVASLTLCCTFPGFDTAFSAEQRAEFVRMRKEPLLAGKTPREMAPAVARSLLGPNASQAHFDQLVESMAALHTESYIKTIEATTLYDRPVDLNAIAAPTLLNLRRAR